MLLNKNSYVIHSRISHAKLTFKELEVLSLCKKGLSCQEISDLLFISLETVKTHRKRIIKKLGLRGKQEFRQFIIELLKEDLIREFSISP
ncbi:helix-turn-helix transcriptional regulator [Marivirga arenosa]|uniref:Helix-turn-helix transcriptional regulator n=1 Tax=Marivirga arenosa TaxID=3059076 RepID=A0AA49JDG0_9BACT|nr:helix-turn-helix transcriptional regulator [Marivirga sp. ABR2-2]WKK84998.2 helix-turn-helix transcriptional regulator [Marivirga sp. ABR2-2]